MDLLNILQVAGKTDLIAVGSLVRVGTVEVGHLHQVVEVVVVDGLAGCIDCIDPALHVTDLTLVESEGPEITLVERTCIVEEHAGLESLCEHPVCPVPVLLVPEGGEHCGSGVKVGADLCNALFHGIAGTIEVLVDLLDVKRDRITAVALEDLETEECPQEESLAPPIGAVVSPRRVVGIVDEDGMIDIIEEEVETPHTQIRVDPGRTGVVSVIAGSVVCGRSVGGIPVSVGETLDIGRRDRMLGLVGSASQGAHG